MAPPDDGGKRRRGPRLSRPLNDEHEALDARAPRVTLPLSSRPAPAASEGAARQAASGAPLDGWNQDRVRRSTFPPDDSEDALPCGSSAPPGGAAPSAAVDDARGDAFDLVHRTPITQPTIDLSTEMKERFILDDFSGSLRAAEFLLGRNPRDPVAQRYAQASRARLETLLHARLTQDGRVPTVAVAEAEVRWLGLDPRAQWLLSRIDGHTECDELIDAAGLPRLEGLRLLTQLLDAGAVRMG